MKKLLWLDDYRNPFENKNWLNFSPIGKNCEVICVKDYEEFTKYIIKNGLPDAICFDHDLETEKTGYDCAKWLVEYHQNYGGEFPKFSSQSANPVGRENILNYLKNYLKNV